MTQSIDLVRPFKDSRLGFIDVSIGFSTPHAQIPCGANFVAPIAERVRNETGLPGSTSWYISDAVEADAMIENGQVDLVMLGRPLLAAPHWPYAAARTLGIERAAWVLPPP